MADSACGGPTTCYCCCGDGDDDKNLGDSASASDCAKVCEKQNVGHKCEYKTPFLGKSGYLGKAETDKIDDQYMGECSSAARRGVFVAAVVAALFVVY